MRPLIILMLLLVLGALTWTSWAETKSAPNMIAIHDAKSPQYNKDCQACHGKRDSEESLKAGIPRVHTTHIKAGLECTQCHKTVDLKEHSAASLRRQVEMSLCVDCHSKSWFKGGEGK